MIQSSAIDKAYRNQTTESLTRSTVFVILSSSEYSSLTSGSVKVNTYYNSATHNLELKTFDGGSSWYVACVSTNSTSDVCYCNGIKEIGNSVSYSKGTSAGTVSSTSRSAYPDNGYSGSYWYVFVG